VFDIVFISYNEPNAEANLFKLKERFPLVKHVHGVTGIHQAHIAAAKRSFSPMFWVVDGDADVLDTFNFDYTVVKEEYDIVHVWRSRNPVNGLEYGYGGVKLLPKALTLKVDVSSTDMTTNISPRFKAMDQVSNITAFNTDPFSTWRSAFRECCKLAVTNNEESLSRLHRWCTINDAVPYGYYAYLGALAGKLYGEKNASDKEALCKINDFSWLQDQMSLEKFQQ
jgi:hypothetical protein